MEHLPPKTEVMPPSSVDELAETRRKPESQPSVEGPESMPPGTERISLAQRISDAPPETIGSETVRQWAREDQERLEDVRAKIHGMKGAAASEEHPVVSARGTQKTKGQKPIVIGIEEAA